MINLNNIISMSVLTMYFYYISYCSVAILRYLCHTYNVADHWYPKDSTKQARIDEYLEWQHINTRADCALYYLHKVIFNLL